MLEYAALWISGCPHEQRMYPNPLVPFLLLFRVNRETSESMKRERAYEAFLTALFNNILKLMMHYREGQNIVLTEALKDRK